MVKINLERLIIIEIIFSKDYKTAFNAFFKKMQLWAFKLNIKAEMKIKLNFGLHEKMTNNDNFFQRHEEDP